MKHFFAKVFVYVLLISAVTAMAQSQDLPTRSEIQDTYKWDLTDLYPTNNDWENDYKWIERNLSKMEQFKGKLGNSPEELLSAFKFMLELNQKFSKLYLYASLSKDVDLSVGKNQIMFERAQNLGSQLSAATSFINPEIMEISREKITDFMRKNKELSGYDHIFDNMYRNKDYMLPAEQEKLLAQLSPISQIPRNTYVILNDAELPFPTIKDEDGNDVKVTHGRYRSALYSSNDRSYRERVYKGIYQPYDQLKNTLSTIYNGRARTRVIQSQIRGYESPLQMALFADNVPVDVYDNLVKAANDKIDALHRWTALKKKVLGYDELHPYDTYTTLFPGVQKEYSYDEAKVIILEALKPLGEEYHNALVECFDNRWIDVYETKSKRSGAYSNSCACGVHPWVLINWNNTVDDLFTLAHELGHNMHSYFTEKHQPFHYSDYSIFVAEVAAITNEAILLDYLIANASNKEEKLALLEKFLVNAQATFFRQTRFAEFEKVIHEKALKGEFLNAEQLTELFGDMYQKYWGPEMKTDHEEGLSWARIPHLFKYNFYVFQYATGFAAAQAFSEKFKEEGQSAVDSYLQNFIYAGSSDYPIAVLKNAGVDMSSPDPIYKTIDKFNSYLDEMEKLLNE
jgi:oligoendopeptidase F